MIDSSPAALISLNERLRADASGMQKLWRQTGQMCMTRKVSSLITSISGTPSQQNEAPSQAPDVKLLNSVAIEANNTLAAGLMSWIMPSEGRWFSWKPAPQQKGNEPLTEWLDACTEIAIAELKQSNFYSAVHEVLLDRSTFGTAALWVAQGKRNALHFQSWDVGSYVIGEDEEGVVNIIPRQLELTASQAEKMFGKDALPPQVVAQLNAGRIEQKDRYLHFIFERDKPTGTGPKAMPIASVYLHLDTKKVVRDAGFEEMPAIVTRHLRWSMTSAYGSCPAMQALAEIRGVNYFELLLATLAETQVNPRMILPQGFQGVPDLSAGGITFGGLGKDSFPVEWMTQGRIDYGMQFIERKEQAIKNAFHNKLFNAFGEIKGDPNIPHIEALKAEQLGRISPAFTMLTTELINPTLERVFMLLYRANRLPPPPRDAFVTDALGRSGFMMPSVAQTNRMSQEMQMAKQGRFAQWFQSVSMLAQMGQPVSDNLDSDKITRDLGTDAGLYDYLKPIDERERLRRQRQMAAQAQQQQAMLMEAAKNPEVVKQVAGAMGGGEDQ